MNFSKTTRVLTITIVSILLCISVSQADEITVITDADAENMEMLELDSLLEPSGPKITTEPAGPTSEPKAVPDEQEMAPEPDNLIIDTGTVDESTSPPIEPELIAEPPAMDNEPAAAAKPEAKQEMAPEPDNLIIDTGTIDESASPLIESDLIDEPPATDGKPAAAAPKPEWVKVPPQNVTENTVEVSEQFYKLTRDTDTGAYRRIVASEAHPGDLIELVVTAVNTGDYEATNLLLTNTVPLGPIQMLRESITINEDQGLYRLSRNGSDFFPKDTELDDNTIRYIQWLIFKMPPNKTFELSYRLRITE
ncbi:MAG: hypothetical protein P8X79_03645 [Reinekea sp.]